MTPWTVVHQARLSLAFPRQEYWSGLPFPSPGDLPNPGIKPKSLASPALAGRFITTRYLGSKEAGTSLSSPGPHRLYCCLVSTSLGSRPRDPCSHQPLSPQFLRPITPLHGASCSHSFLKPRALSAPPPPPSCHPEPPWTPGFQQPLLFTCVFPVSFRMLTFSCPHSPSRWGCSHWAQFSCSAVSASGPMTRLWTDALTPKQMD